MPKRSDIKKVLVIGSGPIVIGQAAEFDYAGAQACRALKEEGLQVVLINSNPATIMTDKAMADAIYIEPLNLEVIKRIIKKERPDSILSTLGGQTGLNLSMQLAKSGFLEQEGVKLLGANPETIDKAEDRAMFKQTMEEIGQPCIPSEVVTTVEAALDFVKTIGYPAIIRPAFTLGGTGGGIAYDEEQFIKTVESGLFASPITQVLVEKCISGWKEIEFEVMRDSAGNVITVCSMENFDPVGVHTGDSIVVAPAQTLSDKDYQMLRTAALEIISALGVEGGCNVQYALNPDSFDYAVIEVNPRVSRSSALASKATGYPIAKVATKIAIGYNLDEIVNAVTGKTCACFEPALDYIVAKFPKWPFDKFVYAKRELGTQMKATGEVMAIGQSFEEAMMKAVRSIELSLDTLDLKKLKDLSDEEIKNLLSDTSDERAFVVFEALKRGISQDEIFDITKIDRFFLGKLQNLIDCEVLLQQNLNEQSYKIAKKYGFLDSTIERISGQSTAPFKRHASYKMVDTCAAEFDAKTPYFYSGYDEENEAHLIKTGKEKKVLVIGSGPIRIGQGIEFDYCCVHCVWALSNLGYETIIANNNPETVSTDFDTADKLYFDPLTPEDIDNVLETEKPYAAVVQFGGQTAIKLVNHLKKRGIKILGTSPEMIDAAEDREKFDAILESCGIKRPVGQTVFTAEEALAAANELIYPVLLRPSYVLGGQNMIIAFSDKDVVEYMNIITAGGIDNPVLIDKYMTGVEVEVDAICDGTDFLIPGIMEHIERAGVHSGDSISVYPAQNLKANIEKTIIDYTEKLAKALNIIGLMNIQFVVSNGEVYVIEVNPRSSRTVPYISKVTGVPMVEIATKIFDGQTLKMQGYESGVYKKSEFIAIKVPVFSFEKLGDLDTVLGPEMKSTGEVLGIAKDFDDAIYKGLTASGFAWENEGAVLFTLNDNDKIEGVKLAEGFEALGYEIYATEGTALTFNSEMVATSSVAKINEPKPNILSLIEERKFKYIISTAGKARDPQADNVRIRRAAVEKRIPCITAIDTAAAVLGCHKANKDLNSIDLIDITKI